MGGVWSGGRVQGLTFFWVKKAEQKKLFPEELPES